MDSKDRNAVDPDREHAPRFVGGDAFATTGELPSVALTQRFLVQCEHHGSQRFAVRLVAVGRSTGASGLPESDDWTAWDVKEMRAAVEYLERKHAR